MARSPRSRAGSSRRLGRLVLAAAVSAATLALPACGGGGGGDDSPAVSPPAAPGANVDPNATSGVGGVINKAKSTAADAEERDATMETAVPSQP